MERVTAFYARMLPGALKRKWWLIAAASALLVTSFVLIAGAGADFLPRIDEGDMVVTIRRAPSINLAQARELDLATERVLRVSPRW